MKTRYLLTITLFTLGSMYLYSQNVPGGDHQPHVPLYRWSYGAKFAPRIGGWIESANDKVRLDIGGTIPLYAKKVLGYHRLQYYDHVSSGWDDDGNFFCDEPLIGTISASTTEAFSIGIDFYTWSRLRSENNFKFPVEGVDYYFGFYGSIDLLQDSHRPPLQASLRIAHISAHLVDGDPQFVLPNTSPIVYSREFIDLLFATELLSPIVVGMVNNDRVAGFLRPYAGAQWLFSTIPDTLGRITPYAGFDLALQLLPKIPLTLKAGYEFRLNTEYKTIGEHSLRVGFKLAEAYNNGLIIEGGYYSGRSPYGQYFDRKEEYFSLGFLFEH